MLTRGRGGEITMFNTSTKRSNLIEWQKENGYKSSWVAKKLGLTITQYADLKSGRRSATLRLCDKLIKEFHLDYATAMRLLDRDNERERD